MLQFAALWLLLARVIASSQCEEGCESRGNCNQESGLCECNWGWQGEITPMHPMHPMHHMHVGCCVFDEAVLHCINKLMVAVHAQGRPARRICSPTTMTLQLGQCHPVATSPPRIAIATGNVKGKMNLPPTPLLPCALLRTTNHTCILSWSGSTVTPLVGGQSVGMSWGQTYRELAAFYTRTHLQMSRPL